MGKIAQKVIVEHEGKILLVQDTREERDIWELPGGRMNVDEEPRVAMQREFFEEMGTAINTHEVLHMEQFIQGNEGLTAFMIVYRATLSDAANAFSVDPKEVSQVGWFTEEEVNLLTLYPEHRKAVKLYFSS